MRNISSHRRGARRVAVTASAVLAVLLFLGAGIQDELEELAKGMDLIGTVYRDVISSYVDSVRPVALMKAGIKGMLGALDPYTTFVDEMDRADVDMITTGSYGGIGITVANRNGRHYVGAFLDHQRQAQSPLRLGDEILGVDSVMLRNTSPEELRRMLRGRPGTDISLLVRRPGRADSFRCVIARYSVAVRTISIFDSLPGGMYYIKLDRFTHGAAEDVRSLLLPLTRNPRLKGIVLDLRDNPGGLLEAAVDIVEQFVPRASLVVTTRGRQSQYTNMYSSDQDPLLPAIPLAVLVNAQSASASEICAGAIQDLDRGVIIGTRSFGKGLVQNVIPLRDGASLKLTTSKYYIPSGRCIQKTDYSLTKKDGIIIPEEHDSARAYYTMNGRRVREAGGIEPDIVVADDSLPQPVRMLVQNGLIFDFVSREMNRARIVAVPEVDHAMRRAFKLFVDSVYADSMDTVSRAYQRMLELAEKNHYNQKFLTRAGALQPLLKEERAGMIDQYWDEVRRELQSQFAYHIGTEQLRFRYHMAFDPPLRQALALLGDPARYAIALRESH
jgi:carboxyl-terminal processing protease